VLHYGGWQVSTASSTQRSDRASGFGPGGGPWGNRVPPPGAARLAGMGDPPAA